MLPPLSSWSQGLLGRKTVSEETAQQIENPKASVKAEQRLGTATIMKQEKPRDPNRPNGSSKGSRFHYSPDSTSPKFIENVQYQARWLPRTVPMSAWLITPAGSMGQSFQGSQSLQWDPWANRSKVANRSSGINGPIAPVV
jgi:hypothetical protein